MNPLHTFPFCVIKVLFSTTFTLRNSNWSLFITFPPRNPVFISLVRLIILDFTIRFVYKCCFLLLVRTQYEASSTAYHNSRSVCLMLCCTCSVTRCAAECEAQWWNSSGQQLPQTCTCSTSDVLGFDFAKTTEAELNIMTSDWTVFRKKSWYKILLLNVKHLESWQTCLYGI
jgi:hypothetical protein